MTVTEICLQIKMLHRNEIKEKENRVLNRVFQSLIFPPDRPLDSLQECMFMLAKKPLANIVCSLKSPTQHSPSSTVINFWFHISLEKIGKSTLNGTSISLGEQIDHSEIIALVS